MSKKNLIRKNHLLTQEQIKFLENIDDLGASEHLRRAVDDYKIKIEKLKSTARTSPSGRNVTS